MSKRTTAAGIVLVVASLCAGCSDSDTGAGATTTANADVWAPQGASTSAGAGSTVQTLPIDGNNAAFVLHVPAGLTGKAPTVIVLHGANGNGAQIERVTGMSELADANRFLAAYPDETSVEGVQALIRKLTTDHDADPARIYVAGISRGGANAQGVGCRLSGQVAAIASLSSGLPDNVLDNCMLDKPLPVMLIHGTADPIVPFEGGVPNTPNARKYGYRTLSEPDTLDFWRRQDGCGGDTTVTEVPGTEGTVSRTTGGPCADNVAVALYSVLGGGHTWPGGSAAQEQYTGTLGALNTKFDASQAIWDFFSGKPR
ncbi:PHB depolymerase family esterase [Nocardia sp. NPDC051832]|uniref:alpha/beta hydrolase family esterase n=1 Tax=Nocardia sp. NPDC051832 TaxID=3155673 RepID=UPI003444E0EA